MADVYTDGGVAYANLLAAGYDKFLEYQLRSEPVFRQLVDKHPVDVTNVGPTVTLSLIQEFAALATTPLTETSDVAAVAPPAPVRVTVTVNEYGNAEVTTLRLQQLAFTAVDPAIANVLGKNMVDSLDSLVKSVVDASTHAIGANAGTIKTEANSFAVNSVTATDILSTGIIRDTTALLRRRNVNGRDARGQFVSIIHPDVAVDVRGDTGWLNPHQYVDTANIYNAEIGAYGGTRFVESPRCTTATNTGSVKVYNTYTLGSQALVEATIADAHTVVGPVIDRLRRFQPMGWLYHGGWAIFRPEAIQIAKSASSIAAL